MPRLVCALLVFSSITSASADESVEYLREVKPILAKHCFACHGALRQRNDLRLDAISFIRQGGASGKLIVAGKPDQSLLMHALLGRNDFTKMPPDDSGQSLTADEISKIALWIRSGAKARKEAIPPDPRQHWSYRPPKKMPDAGTENPIDLYFARVHREQHLTPQPSAPREMLLRRLYLDLIGLPPSVDEISSFLNDNSKDANAKVVRRLLSSPHHGERWGRHWMDVWRYTDWFGLGKEVRYSQKYIWRWRDWIIESLNEDKGYDRMIVEMLAADEMAGDDPETLRATGFLARNWYLFNRNYWLDDVVHHTAKGFLGITLNCARCHDHKYDPISQEEYYQLRAFFEPHKVRLDPIPGQPDLDKDGLPRVFDENINTPTYLFIRGSEETPDKSRTIRPQTFAVISELTRDIKPVELPVPAFYPSIQTQHIESVIASLQQKLVDPNSRRVKDRERRERLLRRYANLRKRIRESGTSSTTLIHDEFSSYDTKVWRQTGGSFEYKDSHVLHTNLTGGQQRLESQQKIPADFVASLRLKVVGGNTRSIGMAFDTVGGDRIGVYLSPGSRFVSMYQIVNGAETYPARKNLPVANGKIYDLTFAVRGQLLNVWLNGEFAFAHRLRIPRRDGGFAITNYQAAAEYHAFSLSELETNAILVEKTDDGNGVLAPSFVTTPESIKQQIDRLKRQAAVDEIEDAAATLEIESFRARAVAERVKYGLEKGDANKTATAASRAERTWNEAKARLSVKKAASKLEHEQAKKNNDKPIKETAKRLEEAKTKFLAATKSLEMKTKEYSPIGKVYPNTSSGRRTALARWIASADNPLTARVLVNHVWTRHFGDSLVDSMFDFGLRTKPPRHQELLDHLATAFVENGWSMKYLHRVICESKLYQMHSSGLRNSEKNQQLDPDNKDYWRMNTRRMEHEIIRDSLLAVAGRLNPKIGGPDLPTDQAEKMAGTRRSIYYRHARDDKIRMSRQFDDASVEECYRRKQTIVPQQALVLANSEFVQIQVEAVATRLASDLKPEQTEEFVKRAFQTLLGREPTAEESAVASKAMNRLDAAVREHGIPSEQSVAAARRHLTHVLVMHNDFIMIR